MSDYTPRLFVKGDAEQLSGSPASEVRLRYDGWRPLDEVQSAADQKDQTPGTAQAAEGAAKRGRSKATPPGTPE